MLHVDPDIRRAHTLPGNFYSDPEYFERTKIEIFVRSWQMAAGPECGKGITPFTLLPELLGEELIISRGFGGHVTCLSNVCTHRGMILVDQPCQPDVIRCPYHGRRFSPDGKFLSMPEFKDAVDFPSESDNLAQIPSFTISNFVFVSLDAAFSAEEVLGPAVELLKRPEANHLKPVGRKEYSVKAHWALYCENYLEGFHIPYVHRGLNERLDFGSYEVDLMPFAVLQKARSRDGDLAALYLFIFPNLMLNLYPGGLSVNIVRPVDPSRTIIEYRTYANDTGYFGTGADTDLEIVEIEDEKIVEAVNRGIRSRYYRRGRYSPAQERGVHHFHRLICKFLEETAQGQA